MEGYVNSEILVETDWLASNLNDPHLVIVDCESYPSYMRAHIENAVGLEVHPFIRDPNYPQVMAADTFAELVETMGIGDDTYVIAYDNGSGLTATRLWWVLNYYGKTRVSVLNGGWAKWFGEGRPTTTGNNPKPKRGKFTPQVNPDMVCTLDQGISKLSSPEVIFLDLRSDEEWEGTNGRGNKRAGHIPGAVHIEWLNFLSDGPYQTFRPYSELRAMLEKVGATPEKEVVTY